MPSIQSLFQLHLYKLRRAKSLAAMEFKVLRLDGEQLPGGRIALCGGFFQPIHGFFTVARNQCAGKIHLRQIGLRWGMAKLGGFFVIAARFFAVFGHTLPEPLEMTEIAQRGEVVIIGQRLPKHTRGLIIACFIGFDAALKVVFETRRIGRGGASGQKQHGNSQ